MTETYTCADVAKMLKDTCTRLGSIKRTARAMNVSPCYVSNVILGHIDPGPAILDYFGLSKVEKGVYISALGDGRPIKAEFDWQEFSAPKPVQKVVPKPVRNRDPMKRLGDDYVTAKLDGYIRIPRGRGKQIVME